ncbi:B-box zinc finger protein (macronuclear) [Tetrahymena thermophila SB210]|uniref:B-box zinc finger protein n=1 Tax=Tetrahymena thermophila (strain SB210) TaxID=312017 RepID=Q22SN2_TETTS|nr:B-box zinc finger protein [Tetrahymena thermophila SB210]EAR87740.2 B-box zinc finger protein [Tetrahymena thermophila SB210]|eukprot:XP_001007985.2 B-box zinc finger protein [Tetrahymena thermophila SB210]
MNTKSDVQNNNLSSPSKSQESEQILNQINEARHFKKDGGYKQIKQLLKSQEEHNLAGSSFNEPKVYRPFQVPPDFEQARLHGQAKKIGKISRYTKLLESGQCCICCKLPFKKIPFKIKERIEKFASLGPAFTLFFYYNKQMSFILMLVFLVGGLQNLIDTYKSCENSDVCQSFMGIIYSKQTQRNCYNDFFTQQLLNFITFWVLFFGVIIFKILQDAKDKQMKKKMPNHSDFTIMIKNVPETNCEEEFKSFLEEKLLPNRKLDIANINRVFKIQEYFDLAQEKIKLVNEREKLKRELTRLSEKVQNEYRFNLDSQNLSESNQQGLLQKKQLKKSMKKLNKDYMEKKETNESQLAKNQARMTYLESKYQDYSSEGIRTAIVFVTFNKFEDCQAVKDKYFKPGFKNNLSFKGRLLKFRIAFEPLDIIWENLETPYRTKLLRRSIFLLMALLLTTGSLVAVSSVSQWQKSLIKEKNEGQITEKDFKDSMASYALSVFCTVIVATINSLLTIIITLFSKYEKHNTFTSTSVSVSLRLSWIQFINTALVPFVILLILSPSENLQDQNDQEFLQYVIQNIFFIFIGNAIFVPLVTMYEPEYLWKKIYRWWVVRNAPFCRKTQQQLNEIFEDPEFLIQEYYAIVNRIILSGFFYATMLSLGILIKGITMIMLFWAFKFTFINHSAYPKCLSSGLNSQMQQVMFFIPIIFTVGNLMYGKFFLKCESSNLFTTFNIIQITFGFLLIIFHSIFVTLAERFHKSKINFENYIFEKLVMGLSYQQANPITRAFNPENKHIEMLPSKEMQSSLLLDNSNEQIGKSNHSQVLVESLKQKTVNIRQKAQLNMQTNNLKSSSVELQKSLKDSLKIQNFNSIDQALPLSPQQVVLSNNYTSNSIIDYAFTNILLRRERENQIISAAFERKKTMLIRRGSLGADHIFNESQNEEEEDDDDEDEDIIEDEDLLVENHDVEKNKNTENLQSNQSEVSIQKNNLQY